MKIEKSVPAPMTEKEAAWWEIHKNCDLAKREHKWQWKIDITSGQPHATDVFCVHCGVSASISGHEVKIHGDGQVFPTLPPTDDEKVREAMARPQES